MDFSAPVQRRLETETLIWMTTVRSDGTPQSSLVWFLWDGERLLIYSRQSSRIRNVADNPNVALNFNSNAQGGAVVTITGIAVVDESQPPVTENENYLEKYGSDITRIGHTPSSFADAYPIPMIVTLATVRAWGN